MAAVQTFSLAFGLIKTNKNPKYLSIQNYGNRYVLLSFLCISKIANVATIPKVETKSDRFNA